MDTNEHESVPPLGDEVIARINALLTAPNEVTLPAGSEAAKPWELLRDGGGMLYKRHCRKKRLKLVTQAAGFLVAVLLIVNPAFRHSVETVIQRLVTSSATK